MASSGRLAFLLLLSACSTKSIVTCTEQATCEPFLAFCVDGVCRTREELDLGPEDDFGVYPDLAVADLAVPACTAPTDCSDPSLPICDAQAQSCRGCAQGECSGDKPICLPSGACAQCAAEADCAASQGICELTSHACVPCSNHAQCSSKICDQGKCVAASSITHVSLDGSCESGDGSIGNPLCNIELAIGGNPYVLVAGNAAPHSALYFAPTQSGRTVIVGPGPSAATPATIATNLDLPALNFIANAGLDVTLELDGLVLRTNGTMSNPGIRCGGTGTGNHRLIVRNSRITAATGSALWGHGCRATVQDSRITGGFFGVQMDNGLIELERDVLDGSPRGAVFLTGTIQYAIESCLIAKNGGVSAESAVSLGDSKNGVFRFNTIVENVSANSHGGINCGDGLAKTIESSLVIGNTMTPQAITSQLTGNCTLLNVITPSADALGTHGTPAFVGANDFRLVPGSIDNQACCTNKIDSGPALDVRRYPRPVGAKWDIGAYEVE